MTPVLPDHRILKIQWKDVQALYVSRVVEVRVTWGNNINNTQECGVEPSNNYREGKEAHPNFLAALTIFVIAAIYFRVCISFCFLDFIALAGLGLSCWLLLVLPGGRLIEIYMPLSDECRQRCVLFSATHMDVCLCQYVHLCVSARGQRHCILWSWS